MSKRRIIAILIAFVITIAVTAMWSAATVEREGDPDVNVIEDAGGSAGNLSNGKGGGNKIVKVLAAPFKAIGGLFRHNNEGKLQRMTEKDAEKFASVGVAKIETGNANSLRAGITGSASEHLAAGKQFLQDGKYNEAIAELSLAASLDPKLSEAHNLLGIAFTQKGFSERAKDSFERAIKNEPEDADTLNNLGFSLYQSGNYRAAIDRLKRAAKLAPTDERILNNLGLAYCRVGKFDEAFKSFSRAAGPLTGNLNTAKMLERFAREDDAIRYYEAARQIDPANTLALRRLADLYQRVGKPAEAQAARVALASPGSAANVASVEK